MNNLYQVDDLLHDAGSIRAIIVLNEKCEIFKGHFPGQPVLPGACMIQIAKEILEAALTTKLLMVKADQLKFLAMVEPSSAPLTLNITYKKEFEIVTVKGILQTDRSVCFKFIGKFKQ